MGIRPQVRYLANLLMICALLSSSALARNWHWRHAKATGAQTAQTQDDSGKKPAQDSPAQEQPAQDQAASDNSQDKKSSTEKTPQAQESTGKPEEQKDSKGNEKQAPAEPSPAAPDANPSNSGQLNSGQSTSGQPSPSQSGATPAAAPANSQPGTTPDTNAPQTGAPETPTSGAAGEAPTTSTEPSNPSVVPKSGNHNHKNSNRTKIVREGGAADANALLSPSMPLDQASGQIQKTAQLLSSAEANLQKISTRKLNPDQQAMVDQIHSYMQQATEALNRGDLQRGHNLALKANLLADDLARH